MRAVIIVIICAVNLNQFPLSVDLKLKTSKICLSRGGAVVMGTAYHSLVPWAV